MRDENGDFRWGRRGNGRDNNNRRTETENDSDGTGKEKQKTGRAEEGEGEQEENENDEERERGDGPTVTRVAGGQQLNKEDRTLLLNKNPSHWPYMLHRPKRTAECPILSLHDTNSVRILIDFLIYLLIGNKYDGRTRVIHFSRRRGGYYGFWKLLRTISCVSLQARNPGPLSAHRNPSDSINSERFRNHIPHPKALDISSTSEPYLLPVHTKAMQQQAQSPQSPQSGSSSPVSSFSKLCRKLSPRRTEKRSALSITPTAPACGKFERVFRYFDEDGDGKVSPAELRSCMMAVGVELTAEESEAVVESADSDGDGLLGLEDFVRLVDSGGSEEEESRDLREAFGMYQMEGLGCITPKSLKRMLSRLGEKKTIDECEAMICRFDLNGDGVLSFEEFRVMMV
ncbi:hypothetical protein ACLOJK_019767 [Asimina triloba]